MADAAFPASVATPARQSGTVAVSAGLVVLGVTSLAFIMIVTRSTTPAEASVIAVLWSLVYGLGPGLFAPLEQEATRAVAERRTRGESVRGVVVRAAVIGVSIAVLVSIGLTVAHRQIADRLFGGNEDLVAVLVAILFGMCGLYVTRGVLAGDGRYWTYAGQLSAEGALRTAAAVVLAALGWATVTNLGLTMAIAALVVLLATVFVLPRRGGRGRASSWREVTRNLGWLLLASLVAQGVANAGPLVLQVMESDDPGLAGRFLVAFTVVRLPLFFASALQASLLPQLVRAVERSDRQAFVASLRAMVRPILGLGAVVLVVLAVAGPPLMRVVFGAGYALGRVDLILLALSNVLFLFAWVLQSAVVALRGHRAVSLSWVLSGLGFVVACVLPFTPLHRIETAYLLSSALVAGSLLMVLVRAAAAHSRSTPVADAQGRPLPG